MASANSVSLCSSDLRHRVSCPRARGGDPVPRTKADRTSGRFRSGLGYHEGTQTDPFEGPYY
eukprot:1046278-Pyramimonas_sp.AAC.1